VETHRLVRLLLLPYIVIRIYYIDQSRIRGRETILMIMLIELL
jgi:hypothetical protein